MNLGRQKIDLEDVARSIQAEINKLTEDRKILLTAIDSIEKNKEDILEGSSILAQEARQIMRSQSMKK